MADPRKLVVALSGPSGVGKGRIIEALDLYARLGWAPFRLNRLTRYTTRGVRSGEQDGVDYWYCYGDFLEDSDQDRRRRRRAVAERYAEWSQRPLEGIEPLDDGQLLAYRVRSDTQAVYLPDILRAAEGPGIAFLDLNPSFFQAIRELVQQQPWGPSLLFRSIYVTPLTSMEILRRAREHGLSWDEVIRAEMRRRLAERRAAGRSHEDEQELEIRAAAAPDEMRLAFENPSRHDVLVVNPCGEGHPDWGTPHTLPVGSAAQTVATVQRLIETWARGTGA